MSVTESLLRNTESRVSDLQFRLQHLLQPLEYERLEMKKRTKRFWIVFLCTVVTTVTLLLLFQPPTLWVVAPLVIIFIGAIVGYVMYVYTPKQTLINSFNSNIIPHIVSEFLNDGVYSHHSCIPFHEYETSDLYRKPVDRYNGNSLITGTLGSTSMKFSKLYTEYKTETRDKNGRTQTTWHTIFKGILLIADSNKHFKGHTYILPDTAERMFGGVGRWFQEKFGTSGRGEMVYMEDAEFEKHYVVYANDPVEARYLLTPNMQQYFVELVKYIGKGSIRASFIEGKLYLALSGNFELFAFKMNKPLTDTITIKHYVQNLLHILTVIEILDLNTRIWGK